MWHLFVHVSYSARYGHEITLYQNINRFIKCPCMGYMAQTCCMIILRYHTASMTFILSLFCMRSEVSY